MKRATVKSEGSKMSLYGLAGMESMEDDDGEWADENRPATRNAAKPPRQNDGSDDGDDDNAMDEDD